MNSLSTGEQQSTQDGEPALYARAVRHWEAPCEPRLLSKAPTHPPELAPVRTGKAWEKPDELDLDNASYLSPGSGVQFSARSAIAAEGVVAFERCSTGTTLFGHEGYCQPLDSTRGVQDGLHGDTIAVDAASDAVVPRSALQRLRDRRHSARVHHDSRNVLGVSRNSALTALRRRREHAAASKATACEQMILCSTSETQRDSPARHPTDHAGVYSQQDSGVCAAVQQKRTRMAPLSNALLSSAGLARAHATGGYSVQYSWPPEVVLWPCR